MKKRLLAIITAIIMCFTMIPTIVLAENGDEWDGSSVDTAWYKTDATSFAISTGAQLAGLAQIVNGTDTDGVQDSFKGKTITLTNDIELNLNEWVPIGTSDNPFQGKFDGGSHSIKNLCIKAAGNNQGLFGYIQDAEICNVMLSNVLISGDTNVGGIAGSAVNSTIKECTVNSEAPNGANRWSIRGSESVGGIVGCSKDSHIQKCKNNAYVYLLISGDEPARHKLGGIAGVATLSADECSEEDAVLIAGCENTGTITCTTEANFECTGGIVGRLVSDNAYYRAIVKDCTNTGPVSSIEAGTGGIVGYAQNASIENCGNKKDITGTTGVGGIAGYAYYGTQILNCTNYGSVTGNNYETTETTVYAYNIGGIVGSIYNPKDTSHLEGDCDSLPVYSYNRDSLISNCTNEGNVTCSSDLPETTPEIRFVDGVPYAINVYGSFVGGIAGFAVDSTYFDEEGNVVRIESCTNIGNVTGKSYVGGILGVGKNADVADCTNSGNAVGWNNSDSDSIRPGIGGYSYTVRFDANGGTLKSEDTLNIAAYGVLSSLPTPSRSGSYRFDGWFTEKTGGTKVTDEEVYETDTTLYAHWIYTGGSSASTYSISTLETENGTVSVSPRYAERGDIVTVTVDPDKGYTLETLTVTDKNGSTVDVIDNGDSTYSFTMPAGKVTINATFMEENSMLNFFVDLFLDDYYYDAVYWAAANGITDGIDDIHFAPNDVCTRAQIVTFLWRAAGSPEPETVSSFADVSADSYYAKAVAWAVEQGITIGTGDGNFYPDAPCTRGQSVVFLWRSQKSAAADGVNPFTDVVADDYYADAVLWAVKENVTNGTSETTFSPAEDCTRAQIVTFLWRTLAE